jgi:NTE family protein
MMIDGRKAINIALQGGGAHGAYAWGVLDRLLEDDRLYLEGVTATSAGTVNALALAHGLAHSGSRENARASLENLWKRISDMGKVYSHGRIYGWVVPRAGTWITHWRFHGLMPLPESGRPTNLTPSM